MSKTSKSKATRSHPFERLSSTATKWTGTAWAFASAVLVILLWLICGPIFHYSDTWQLVINTGTTIITFLMVFLIQRAQNKESLAVNLKLNEIIASLEGPSNRLVDIESISEEELEVLHNFYRHLAEQVMRETDIRKSHSIDEAQALHKAKHGTPHRRKKPS